MLRLLKFFFVSLLLLLTIFICLNALFPLKVQISYSTIINDNQGNIIHAYLNNEHKWRMKTELKEVSPQLIKAILFKEDKHFYYHPGIDPFALLRALINNVRYGRKTSGASTITMQVARLLHHSPRTYFNKAFEMFLALQLEINYTKDEIFQFYLSLIPFGGNIEGVKAASLLYYGRIPALLSLSQSVTLAIIPNRPTSLKPGKNNLVLSEEKRRWLIRMGSSHVFSKEEISRAIAEPLAIQRREAPAEAPQFSRLLVSKNPQSPVLQSTLKREFQKKAESVAYNYLQRIKSKNINNVSAIIIENSTRKVLAYVGSADFADVAHAGEVDGVMAMRSPGSTLKPLVYALAIDKGLVTPKSMINDVPVNYSGYKPENFNNKFNGKVPVEKALAYSLNVPAVKMMYEVGASLFSEKLKQAGFSFFVNPKQKTGLSVILGGCGVNLIELAGLYACFANGGQYRPLQMLVEDTVKNTLEIFSEEAAFLVSQILTLPERPDLPNNYESSRNLPKIAWKTGTSYGRRDAWSVGYNKKYTVAVWAGNFDGTGVPELTGADIATPLLFTIFSNIDYGNGINWFAPPKMLDFRLVCSTSGLPPGADCIDQVMDYFLPGISPYKKCTHLKEVCLSADEKISFCTSCLPDAGFKRKKFEFYDPELLDYFNSQRIRIISPPPHNPLCTRVFSESPPKITSPLNEKEYLIQKGQFEQLELKCQVSGDVNEVYWYINNCFYVKAKPTTAVFFTPETGDVKISCSDDKGRNADCFIKITAF